VDVVPLVPKLRKNRTAHIDYIRHTLEEATTLRELVKGERLLSLLNTSLAYACKYTRWIQELLMILQQTCPRITDLGTNLVAVTPKNKTKQIKRTAQLTKLEKTSVATSPTPNIDSNTPVLFSTGVALVSSASGSKYQDNTKKNRIRRIQKKAKETELEDHLRNVKSSLNKAKHINSVNASRKSKSVKKPVKRKVWKSTSKVFKTVGYKWKPIGRTFTLVGNVCPLTRIATATIVPPREPITIVKSMDKPVVTLVALDEALVPSTQRLRIGRSNFRLPSNIQSKEATLQVVYDVLWNSPFFRAFLVTADVPEIYMQEFWATAKLYHLSIRFKMDTKKCVLDLEAFREMLHISPRIPSQSFVELPTEEEILEFLRYLGHSHEIRYLTDVNVNKLYQPWRSFASVINKCLTGKSSDIDSFRLSQAQILWGLYHRRNIDFDYLIWEDFVYQVEHKNTKRSNEMYYPRFTKVIIDYFMTRKPSILRRNKINWHYVRDDVLFSTIKMEYYACATREAAPKPKASARKKKGDSTSSTTPPTPTLISTVVSAPRLSATAKVLLISLTVSDVVSSELNR
nr:hypothetical protein [Tanacetum cinerariifolium]